MVRQQGWKAFWMTGALALVIAGCSNQAKDPMAGMDHTMGSGAQNPAVSTPGGSGGTSGAGQTALNTGPVQTLDGTEAILTAQASSLTVRDGTRLPVWTYNNSVPGPQIRVKQGETVKVTLKNTLPEPVTIHWHGYPVPFSMDGVPGMTQNAVKPGESFTYEFKATVPGTYWYHSHQDSVNQVDRGLYGTLVVEGKNDQGIDRDYTLVLDEWMSHGMNMDTGGSGSMNMGSSSQGGMSGMSGMDHSTVGGMNNGSTMNHGTAAGQSSEAAGSGKTSATSGASGSHDMNMYDLYTINGKISNSTEPLNVKQGDKVRLRLINAGYLTHNLHLHGHSYTIVATDGNPIANPVPVKDELVSIAPGERYDIEFIANNSGKWYLEEHGDNPAVKNVKTLIQYEDGGASSDQPDETVKLPSVNMAQYGKSADGTFSLNQNYSLEYTMNLGTSTRNGEQVFTVNDKVFPQTDPVNVKKGDTVKVRFINTSKSDDHPMHLHGHTFQVLSKNGEPLSGSPVWKDTLNIKPGEEYVVAFEANNPGEWMFHCHDLHHASTGMVTELKYMDFQNPFKPDPQVKNIPE